MVLLVLVSGCGRSPVLIFGSGSAGDGDGDGGPAGSRCGELDGDSFAQVVVGYEPTAGGGQVPRRDDVIDPEAALGPPDHMPTPPLGTVSIGDGGTLTVGFEPCVIGTSLTAAPDLIVHEAGFDERGRYSGVRAGDHLATSCVATTSACRSSPRA